MYEVQIFKYNHDLDTKKVNADGKPALTPPTEEELADQKKTDQATAARIADSSSACRANSAWSTLIQLPVADRIAFTTYVAGDQKSLLLSQFNPRERAIFNAWPQTLARPTRSSTSSHRRRSFAPSSPSASSRR